MSNNKFLKKTTLREIWQYVLFISFYIYGARIVAATFYQATYYQRLSIGFLIFAVFILTIISTRLSLLIFIILIPAINGLQLFGIADPLPLLSIYFCAVYLIWLPLKYFNRTLNISPSPIVGRLVDILISIILVSVTAHLLLYRSIISSSDIWVPFLSPEDDFYVITASQILLQGLYFYRMIEIETVKIDLLKDFRIIIYSHCLIIIVFVFLQKLSNTPPINSLGALYSPFNDTHSFGSYIVFIFFTLLNFTDWQQQSKKYIFNVSLITLFSLFIVFSFSKITFIATIITLLIFIFTKISLKKYLIILSLIIIVLLFVNPLAQPLQKASSLYVRHFGKFIDIGGYLNNDSNLFRISLFTRAFNIIKTYPISGSGMGTFYKFSSYYANNDDKFRSLNENAHNYFLQFVSELGIPALIILLGIILYSFYAGLNSIQSKPPYAAIMKGLLFGLSAYLLTCLTGHPLLLPAQQFLFWFIILCINTPANISGSLKAPAGLNKHSAYLIPLLLLLITTDHVYYSYFSNNRKIKEYGLYGWENINGQSMRWNKGESFTQLTATTNQLRIKLIVDKWNIDNQLNCRVFINNEVVADKHYFHPARDYLDFYLPHIEGKPITIKIIVDKTFCPKSLGLRDDTRQLGLLVSHVRFFENSIPAQGLGFYQVETWPTSPCPQGWPEATPLQVRWTGIRASMGVENYRDKGCSMYLFSNHSDLDKNPVVLKIIGDNGVINKVIFKDHSWNKVTLSPHDLNGSHTLTFQLNRTWNPKLSGVSDDVRDLGIAVAVPDDNKLIMDKMVIPDNRTGFHPPQKDIVALLHAADNLLLAMDFSAIEIKRNFAHIISSITGQKIKAPIYSHLIKGPIKGSTAIEMTKSEGITGILCSPLFVNMNKCAISLWARTYTPQLSSSLVTISSVNKEKLIGIDHEGTTGNFVVYYSDIIIGKSSEMKTDRDWHHYVLAWSDNEMKFYVDMREIFKGPISISSMEPLFFFIGNDWDGAFAQLFTFNRSLSKDEIDALYRIGSPDD